jgi:hypothetical protein
MSKARDIVETLRTVLVDGDIGTDVLAPDGDGSGLTGVDSLPSQTSQSGKFLTTDGSAASWGDAAVLPLLKATSYTAVSKQSIVATAGSITITLPSSPSTGDFVQVKDGTGAAATTNWTVGRNGSNIGSVAADLTIDKNFVELTMVYINSSIGWSI